MIEIQIVYLQIIYTTFALEGIYLKNNSNKANKQTKQNKNKKKKDRRKKESVQSRVRTRHLQFHTTSPHHYITKDDDIQLAKSLQFNSFLMKLPPANGSKGY